MGRAVWLLSLAPLAGADDALRDDWVAKDVAVARRVAAALPGKKLEELLKKLDASDTEEDRDIGFGARRLRLALYGGHTTTWVTVVSWRGGVGPLEIHCHAGDPDTWAGLRDRIAAEYKEAKQEEAGLRVVVGKRADPEGFLKERNQALGPPLGIDPDPALERAYLLLWSPLSDLLYGWMHGEGGDPPDGRIAVERILAHERGPALLDDILRGPNPEGRLYAAEALLRLERKGRKLGEQVRKNIEAVCKSDVKIHVARGCEVSWEPAAKPLEEMIEDAP